VFDVPARPLSFPAEGISRDGLLFRLPRLEDVATVAPAFLDESVGGAANMPEFTADQLRGELDRLPTMLASGWMIPLVVLAGDEIQGGGTLHHLDWQRLQGEIGYWLFPEARGRGTATKTARLLAEHGFALGLGRIEARVNIGNTASERVLERAGFTREGVLRSMALRSGHRVDQTLFSLLPDE
jgi:RimJ/RimL family protein N-acetyltransferase